MLDETLLDAPEALALADRRGLLRGADGAWCGGRCDAGASARGRRVRSPRAGPRARGRGGTGSALRALYGAR
ncbi:hypothetical protein EAO71_15500 [Streptomyces sp. ms191]|nr:hypothetical protein EAO71_15500 [Streptomyces sp. ms191]